MECLIACFLLFLVMVTVVFVIGAPFAIIAGLLKTWKR